jgi:hypothetical protein
MLACSRDIGLVRVHSCWKIADAWRVGFLWRRQGLLLGQVCLPSRAELVAVWA